MLRLIVRRLIVMVPLVVLISFLVFGLILLIPGDPAVHLAGENPSPERIAEVRERMGLDDPFYEQYGRWLGGIVRGDLGESFYSSLTVWAAIWARLPVTLSLTAVTLVYAIVVGVTVGTLAGLRPGSLLDRVASLGSSIGVAAPHFWLGMLLILFVGLHLDLLPVVGYTAFSDNPWEWLKHLIIPSVALGSAVAAEIARQTRAAVSGALQQDYVRTARAKGLLPMQVVGKHAMKNAAIPVITVIGLQASRLVGGTVVIEQLFALPGLGFLAYQAVFERDFPVVQGVVLIAAIAVLVINLLVDLTYGYFNPRIRQS